MIWYQVHGYTSKDPAVSDIETEYEGRSLQKAYRIFNEMKNRYAVVRIDKWEGIYENGSYDGDYVADVECFTK